MSIALTNPSTWGVGDKLTSAQANSLDTNATYALDKRAAETDTLESVVSLAGGGRIVENVYVGLDSDAVFAVDSANRVIQVTTAVTANRNYLLLAGGAVTGDQITVYCEPDFGFEVTVQDQSSVAMYALGNLATSDGAWATFIYIGGWRLYRRPTAREYSQVFTSNGTFTVPAGVFRVWVEGCGGGGGGATGGNAFGTTTSSYNTGGGGGSGALLCGQYVNVTPGGSVAVTTGAGGAAGTDGSDTTFGALATFAGGGKGSAGASGASTLFAIGGSPVRSALQPFLSFGTATAQVAPGVPASGGYGTSNVYTTHNGCRNPHGGFAAGSGGSYGTDSGAYIGGGSGGGGGAGPYGVGGNGGNGGNGNNAGTGGTGTAGAAGGANTGAGGGGGGGLGHGTSAGTQGAGGVGGSGQLTVVWVK